MSRKKAQVGLRARTVDHLNAWLIMLPSLVLMLFFVWEPLFESVVMSLYKTRNIELVNHNLHCIVLNQKSLSFQSKRKGASHISMTHTLLCIYSFLILFQKILRKAFFKHALIPWC